VIVPKFNSKRIAAPGAAADAFKSLVTPLTKSRDRQVKMDVNAANKQITDAKKAAEKAEKAAAKEAAKAATKKASAKTTKTTKKPANTYKGKKPTAAAVTRQNTASKSYVTRKPRGGSLTPAQSSQNAAAKSYMTKTSVPGQSGAAKGRPDTKAGTKTATPGKVTAPKATVNKTGARNVRKATTVTPTKKVSAVKPPAGAGRRKNGAPKSR
jgi:hypothetical protein